ncbi:hypothetical protein Pelo_13411 [Pelomyxa schiedti]|nr:hypothetical protein Pelo_13411 [Pelomyxa schiedti]
MPPDDKKFVRSVCSKAPVRIAFYGHTASGKSSLINSLCGQRILPMRSGYCTARVCVLKYAEKEKACIRTAKVVNGEIQYALGEPFSLANVRNNQELQGNIIKYLARETLLPEESGAANDKRKGDIDVVDIVTTIVFVEYPVPLLKSGIQLVDLPGHAISDPIGKPISKFMPLFLGAYCPHGVVFCYKTAVFDGDEQCALTKMEQVLFQASTGLSADEYIPEVFFANTHVDLGNILDESQGSDLELIQDNDITTSYQKLLEHMRRSPATRSFTISDDFQKCTSFCCVSAHDFLYHHELRTFQPFMDKFLHWIIAVQQRLCCRALTQISSASGTFFENLAALPCSLEDIETKRKTTTERIETGKATVLARIALRTKDLPNLLIHKVEEIKDEFLEKAIALSFEETPRSITSDQAQRYLEEKLAPWLAVNVVHPVITDLRQRIQDDVKAEFQRIMKMEDNDVRELLQVASPTYSHIMRRLAYAGVATAAGLNFAAFLAAAICVPFTGGASAPVAVILGVSACSLAGVTRAIAPHTGEQPIDTAFKKNAAQRMLDKLCDPIQVEKQRKVLEYVCCERTTRYFQRHLDRVTCLGQHREQMKKTDGVVELEDLRLLFGTLNAEALEMRDSIFLGLTIQTQTSSTTTTSSSSTITTAAVADGGNELAAAKAWESAVLADDTDTDTGTGTGTGTGTNEGATPAPTAPGEPIMTTAVKTETATSAPAPSTTTTTTTCSVNSSQTVSMKVDLRKRNKAYRSAFFEDLSHWNQIQHCSTHVLQLKRVFRDNNPRVWCMEHPQFTLTLKDYLEKHIRNMKLSAALDIAKTIITAIRDIHEFGIVCGNLKRENVVVTTEGDKVTTALAGFEVTDIKESNVSGIDVNRFSCSPKVDIFAFGVILSELTRHFTTTGVPQLLAPGTPLQLTNLINQCVTTKLNQRPSAWKVLESLSKIHCAEEDRPAQNLGTGNSN